MTTLPEPTAPGRSLIAIVGRPNVGKSTLFNRLAGARKAIVEDVPGVTRDRQYADGEWDNRPFTVVDTGGFEVRSDDALHISVRTQAQRAIDEADVVLLVVDGRADLTTTDREIAQLLRRGGRPVILVVNKIDGIKSELEGSMNECWGLGFEATVAVSAEHGRGMGQLMDLLEPHCPQIVEPEPLSSSDERPCRVAIVGRPNVGKSTLINRLLGEERFVASPIPGTTTDPNDVPFHFKGREYILTDTAGVRRKRSIEEKVEAWSVGRTMAMIDQADVILLLMDATEPAVEQDARIAGIALEKGKGLAIVVNKWDLVASSQDPKEAEEELHLKMPFVGFAPLVLCSALTGESVERCLRKVEELDQHTRARVPTPQLNEFLQGVCDSHPTPIVDGHRARLFYMAQVGIRPPTFSIACSYPDSVSDDYKRYLVNRMREAFGLKVPIRLLFKARSRRTYRPASK